MPKLSRNSFGNTQDGRPVELFMLTNDRGVTARVTNFGAILTQLQVPDKQGRLHDVALGFDALAPYETNKGHLGSTIGRVGNRIAEGRFIIDGSAYQVAINHGVHHLHGGIQGYDKHIWVVEEQAPNTPDEVSVRLHHLDYDGVEGYPGNVEVWVTYTLTNDNVLRLEYMATTDTPTPINLTNHSYWNLKDGGVTDILGHVLQINAETYTAVDPLLIPTGELAAVAGTPLDFRTPKPIGRDLKAMSNDPQGYDHNYVLPNAQGDLIHAATLIDPTSDRKMETWTTQPGVQFYSGNFLDGTLTGRGGIQYGQRHALCLETQHFPDAVNHAHFPSIILRPGITYRQATEYRFSS